MHAMQIVYYDGQFNDARLNVALACTAALAGATVVNHAKVTKLLKVRPAALRCVLSKSGLQRMSTVCTAAPLPDLVVRPCLE